MNDKVSCLMVTRNRLKLVRRAIRCFQSQSHQNRELIVVDDGEDGTQEYVTGLRDLQIVYIRPQKIGLPLGELRNLAIDSATAKYVTQWDDDDWYHTDRIRIQLAALKYSGEEVCFLNRWTLAWPERSLFGHSKPRFWEGSIFALKEKIGRYPLMRRGEDTTLVNQIRATGIKTCLVDNPELYIYVFHGANTYSAEHFIGAIFTDITKRIEGEEAKSIARKLDLAQYH